MNAVTNSLPPNAPGFSFKTRVTNAWANIELLRVAVIASARAVFNEDVSVAIGTVASELMENAVKYGAWEDHGMQTMRVAVRGHDNIIEVDVSSPSSPAMAARLHEHLVWMRTFACVEEAYLARISELAVAPSDTRSSMGLLRIAVEGNCQLSSDLAQDNILTVCATLADASLVA